MKGDKKAVDHLNRYLTIELTGHHQYLEHARILKNWGVTKLGEREEHYAEEERKHAGELADRILFLEGTADFQRIGELAIGKDVKNILGCDTSLVRQAREALQKGIAHCESVGDYASRELLERMLEDEEEHLHWLEIQLGLIEKVGLQNYVQSQSA